jgi:hypothetical protein
MIFLIRGLLVVVNVAFDEQPPPEVDRKPSWSAGFFVAEAFFPLFFFFFFLPQWKSTSVLSPRQQTQCARARTRGCVRACVCTRDNRSTRLVEGKVVVVGRVSVVTSESRKMQSWFDPGAVDDENLPQSTGQGEKKEGNEKKKKKSIYGGVLASYVSDTRAREKQYRVIIKFVSGVSILRPTV